MLARICEVVSQLTSNLSLQYLQSTNSTHKIGNLTALIVSAYLLLSYIKLCY